VGVKDCVEVGFIVAVSWKVIDGVAVSVGFVGENVWVGVLVAVFWAVSVVGAGGVHPVDKITITKINIPKR
jgi:hypothetical protein